jgi:glycerophosphoryl diester phosphodiesterase
MRRTRAEHQVVAQLRRRCIGDCPNGDGGGPSPVTSGETKPRVRPAEVLTESDRPLLIFGHRGYAAAAVENTLPAFEKAATLGIAGIELDVQLSRDGEVVVAHDGDLSRLGGDPRRIITLTASELAEIALRADRDGTELTARGVPTLNEVIDAVPSPMIIDIELKSYPDTPYQLAAAVARLISDRGVAARVFVSSFDPRLVKRFRREADRIGTFVPTAAIYSGDPEVPRVLRGGLGAPLSGSEITKPDWRTVLRHGVEARRPVLVWTVNTREVFDGLRPHSIAGVIGDNPGDLLRWSRKAGHRLPDEAST